MNRSITREEIVRGKKPSKFIVEFYVIIIIIIAIMVIIIIIS